ncbi:ketol-acid reductoisomerase [candidate division MSBL1 archaeon SCGC-AAA833F18]|uniref:Ketol-acid reductoisomerase (NADP(+)) n=1 Tax=candidate division MSBL1 archaeon SCGC-AAA833F18 TaxID=1698257 RepID=A0A133VTB3_9EURY|nr:ketol-acid reductoisomerase [candidate division MSBL1 archaeon SCGC-AAA833F18]
MAKIYMDEDASLEPLEDKTIAIIGYGNQGNAQANNMRDSGCNVIIGNVSGDPFWKQAKEDDFDVYEISEAAKRGDIIHMLIPDEVQAKVYNNEIAPAMEKGKTLCFSHGFNIHFKEIVPPRDADVIMIAPKAPGARLREEYQAGSGTPGLLAVAQDPSGNAKQVALAMAKAAGLTRIGVVETSFREEVETDLFGEQSVLVGGVSELMKAGFETLIDAGYQPEVAYFECINELKLITDLVHKQGIEGMMKAVSNTAEYGGRTRGSEIIGEKAKEKMKKILKDVQDGTFAKEWVAENERGAPKLKKMREEAKEELVEQVGKELRKWAEIEE